jgi:hypothetical protein
LVEHTIASKNVEFEKGSLLDSLGVRLAESPWVERAYRDATRPDFARTPGPLNYILAPSRRVAE